MGSTNRLRLHTRISRKYRSLHFESPYDGYNTLTVSGIGIIMNISTGEDGAVVTVILQ